MVLTVYASLGAGAWEIVSDEPLYEAGVVTSASSAFPSKESGTPRASNSDDTVSDLLTGPSGYGPPQGVPRLLVRQLPMSRATTLRTRSDWSIVRMCNVPRSDVGTWMSNTVAVLKPASVGRSVGRLVGLRRVRGSGLPRPVFAT